MTLTAGLALTLFPSQIEALEELRAGGHLVFELSTRAEVHDGENTYSVQDQLSARMPQSAWLDQLRNAGAFNVLLLEIPMQTSEAPESEKTAQRDIVAAQRHFVIEEYTSCVSYCRSVIEALGQRAYGSTGRHLPGRIWPEIAR